MCVVLQHLDFVAVAYFKEFLAPKPVVVVSPAERHTPCIPVAVGV